MVKRDRSARNLQKSVIKGIVGHISYWPSLKLEPPEAAELFADERANANKALPGILLCIPPKVTLVFVAPLQFALGTRPTAERRARRAIGWFHAYPVIQAVFESASKGHPTRKPKEAPYCH